MALEREHGEDALQERCVNRLSTTPPGQRSAHPNRREDSRQDVRERDAFWKSKQRARAGQNQPAQERRYEPIEMPKNSATGFVTAFFAVVTGFALIWHIWWMAGVGLFGAFVAFLAFAFRDKDEIEIPIETIAAFDRAHQVEVAR